MICEEPHGLIVMSNAPHNFEQDLALGNEASFDTSNIFGPNSNLIVDLILSTAGAQITASKLIVMCTFGLNELIKLMLASRYQRRIVAYVDMNSKIYLLIFGEKCRKFCEGEWEQQVGNLSFVGSLVLANCCIIDLVSFVRLIKHVELTGHVGHINDFIRLLQLIVICEWTKIFLIF